MRCNTHAIVLSIQRHTDTCWWVQLYTEAFGKMMFQLYGRKNRSFFSPLSVVEIEADEPLPHKIPTIHSVARAFTPQQLPTSVERQGVALFMSEVIASALPYTMQEESLYHWLEEQVKALDSEEWDANFHILFLQHFTRYLGIDIAEEWHPEWETLPVTREQRQERLRALCVYYQEKIESFPSPKSLPVLMEVFD